MGDETSGSGAVHVPRLKMDRDHGFYTREYLLQKEGVREFDGRMAFLGIAVKLIEVRMNGRAVIFDHVKMRVFIATGSYHDTHSAAYYPGELHPQTIRGLIERSAANRVAKAHGFTYCDDGYHYGAGRGYFSDLGVGANEHDIHSPSVTSLENHQAILDRLHTAAIAYLRVVSSATFDRLVRAAEAKFFGPDDGPLGSALEKSFIVKDVCLGLNALIPNDREGK